MKNIYQNILCGEDILGDLIAAIITQQRRKITDWNNPVKQVDRNIKALVVRRVFNVEDLICDKIYDYYRNRS